MEQVSTSLDKRPIKAICADIGVPTAVSLLWVIDMSDMNPLSKLIVAQSEADLAPTCKRRTLLFTPSTDP